MSTANIDSPGSALKYLLSQDKWHKDPLISNVLREPLLSLSAHYVLLEKRAKGTAADSVAHFHLNNGARVEKLNWLADLSVRGLEQSNGIMLNYLYDLKTIDSNHESYRAGEPIMTSAVVKNLL